MNEMNQSKEVINQYKDDSKFAKRQSFHDKYSTNKYGFQKYLNQKFKEFNKAMDFFNIENWSFTLKNGRDVLKKKFDIIEMREYEDSIEIDDENILVEWVLTSTVLQGIEKEKFEGLSKCFAKDKDENGIIHIPKQVGCFVSVK